LPIGTLADPFTPIGRFLLPQSGVVPFYYQNLATIWASL